MVLFECICAVEVGNGPGDTSHPLPSSGKPRPAYEQMMGEIGTGNVDAVVAWHPDRLHRSPKELERFIDTIEASGTAVATVQGGEYDLSTAAGRMTARVVGAVARHESEHKSERARSKAAQLAQSGKLGGGGTRPLGFDNDFLTIRDSEAVEIRDAARRLLAGESVYGIVVDWQRRGVNSPTGIHWRSVPFRRMILSPRIAGLREHRGQVVSKAEWDPIISEAEHYALVTLFADKARRPADRPRAYLLTGGLLRCGLCDSKLVARPKGDKRRCYVCASGPNFNGCGKIRSLAEPLEDLLRDLIAVRLAGPGLAQALADAANQDAEASGAMAALADQEAKLELLAADFAADRISHKEWLAARDAVSAKADALRTQMASRNTGAALATLPSTEEGLRERWDSETMEWRRRLVGLLVDRVTANPAVRGRNFFDPSRFHVAWRV